jgi:hypothetical protein
VTLLRAGSYFSVLAVSLLFIGLMAGCSNHKEVEKQALLSAVREYFKAEMDGDTEKVWKMLAPSSRFKKSYSYPFYQEMTKRNSIRIKEYVVEEIVEIRDNADKDSMPAVEKIGTIKVHVILGSDRGKDTEHSSMLTFLKEGGKWYKG